MTHIYQHPFKEGIYGLLKKHFADSIVDNFILTFEKDIYSDKENLNIWNQKKNNQLVMEVSYKTGLVTAEYICDVYPWESKGRTEVHLLQSIAKAVKSGKIGKDWGENKGKIDQNVISNHETTS